MATLSVTTHAASDGLYDGMPMALETETAAVVTLEIDGLDLAIEADATQWPESGPVTYTMTITNISGIDYDVPLTVTADAFPVSLFAVDVSSVKLNGGTTGFTADVTNGVLMVELEEAVETTPAVITFQVNKN